MAKEAKKNDAPDILDEIREVDKAVRRALLIKVLGHLKYVSKKILRYKLLIQEELAAMGISEEDAKRIIDFINESSEVKLSEDDKKATKRDAKDSIREKKKSIEGEMEKKSVPQTFVGASMATLGQAVDNNYYATSNTGDLLLRDQSGDQLEVKV